MNETDFLFARPSFVGGMASVLDLGATLVVYNQSETPKEADAKAIKCDWEVTGNDIKNSMDKFTEEHNV
jgi:hypothetical protein